MGDEINEPRDVQDGQDVQDGEDDLHRKFREALERKQANPGGGQGTQQPGAGRGLGAASNDKTKRQFRRKSG